jgi:hypothetical protein
MVDNAFNSTSKYVLVVAYGEEDYINALRPSDLSTPYAVRYSTQLLALWHVYDQLSLEA